MRLAFGWMDGFALECKDFFYFQEEWDFCLFLALETLVTVNSLCMACTIDRVCYTTCDP